MIQSEPTTTRTTISTPKASASTLLVLSGPGRDVQEEHEVDAHLRDRQHDEGDRNARLPDQVGAGDEERGRGEQDRERQARSDSRAGRCAMLVPSRLSSPGATSIVRARRSCVVRRSLRAPSR